MENLGVNVIGDDYLAAIEAELDREAEKPHKKTKAQKRKELKERKRLRMISNKQLILRDQLKRELELSKRMQEQGLKNWEQLCLDIKFIELRQELLDWSEQTERQLERKNDTMSWMLSSIEESFENQRRMHSKNIEMIDYFNACYISVIQSLRQNYDTQTEEMLKDHLEQLTRRNNEVEFMSENSKNVIVASNVVVVNEMKQDFENFLVKRDNFLNTEIFNRFELRKRILQKMYKIHNQLVEFVNNLRNTDLDVNKYERITWLTERQRIFVLDSKKLNVEEMKYQTLINDMQREMLRFENATNSTLNDLNLEFDYFQNFRKKMENDQANDERITHEKLLVLTTETYDIIKVFEKYATKGELLLSLANNCRKMQTQSEKIVIGGEIADSVDLNDFNNKFLLKTVDLKSHFDITEEEMIDDEIYMRNFWRRQAIAEAQNLLLLQEKEQLSAENQKYIDFFKSMNKTDKVKELLDLVKIEACTEQPNVEREKCVHFKLKRTKRS